jgi:hypothetical protein
MGIMYKRYADGWRIWDHVDECWRGKFGQEDPDYYAETKAVAEMRVRDWQHR